VVLLQLFTSATEEYNGSSWATNPGSLSTARDSLAGFGIQTAALAVGGIIHLQLPQVQQKNMTVQLGQEEEVYQQQDLILQEQEFKLLG
jgi:hypothetical protein